jgi:hypothetical protein
LHALEEARKDDVSKILDEMWLERSLAVLVSTEIVEQPVHGIGKGLVLRVSVELLANEFELVGDAVSVSAVAASQEIVTLIVDTVPLFGRGILEDVTLSLEDCADVRIEALEPVLKFRIAVSIGVDLVDRVDEVVEGSTVREALK